MSQVTQDRVRLTNAEIAEFFDVGFLRVNQVFTPAEMDEIDAAFERLHEMADEVIALGKQKNGREWSNNVSVLHRGSHFTFRKPSEGQTAYHVNHISWCGGAEPMLSRFGEDGRLLTLASQLLGATEMNHLINQAHFKRPGTDVRFPFHQDSSNRGIDSGKFTDVNGKGSFVQIALAVDDMTEDNGPLMFIPGSCKLGHLGLSYEDNFEGGHLPFDPKTAVTPMLRRGDLAAFGPYTIHGSVANRSKKSRRIFINGFSYPGANHAEYQGDGAGRLVTLENQ